MWSIVSLQSHRHRKRVKDACFAQPQQQLSRSADSCICMVSIVFLLSQHQGGVKLRSHELYSLKSKQVDDVLNPF